MGSLRPQLHVPGKDEHFLRVSRRGPPQLTGPSLLKAPESRSSFPTAKSLGMGSRPHAPRSRVHTGSLR